MSQRAQLPTVDFFTQGNVMTGSCTPEQFVGKLKAEIFNYRAECKKTDECKCLSACYYIGNKCFALTDAESVVSQTFDATQHGVDEAQSWLSGQYSDFLRTLK